MSVLTKAKVDHFFLNTYIFTLDRVKLIMVVNNTRMAEEGWSEDMSVVDQASRAVHEQLTAHQLIIGRESASFLSYV